MLYLVACADSRFCSLFCALYVSGYIVTCTYVPYSGNFGHDFPN